MKPKVAVADFKRVLALEPRNDLARTQLDATQKLIRRVEFEKAIETEEEGGNQRDEEDAGVL